MKPAKKNTRTRIIALLNRSELEFLEKLGMDSLFSTGNKLSRVDIISGLIDAAMDLGVTGTGLKKKKDLVDRILDSVKVQIDRRKYLRLKKNFKVGFRKMDSMGKFEQSITEDISLCGFRVDINELEKMPRVHEVIEIEMTDPNQTDKPIKAIGKIVWIREKENGDGVEAGVMLTHIDRQDKWRYAGCVELENGQKINSENKAKKGE